MVLQLVVALRPERSLSWLASATLHALLIGAVIVLSSRVVEVPPEDDGSGPIYLPPGLGGPPPPPLPPAGGPVTGAPEKPRPRQELTEPVTVPVEAPRIEVETQETEEPQGSGEGKGTEGQAGGMPGGVPGGDPNGQIGGKLGGAPNGTLGGDGNGPPGGGSGPPGTSGARYITPEMTPPRPLFQPDPDYPIVARSAGVAGEVVLKCVITEEGEVTSCVVKGSIPLLDDAALAGVARWRYSPALQEGRPVRVYLLVRVRFTLD